MTGVTSLDQHLLGKNNTYLDLDYVRAYRKLVKWISRAHFNNEYSILILI